MSKKADLNKLVHIVVKLALMILTHKLSISLTNTIKVCFLFTNSPK